MAEHHSPSGAAELPTFTDGQIAQLAIVRDAAARALGEAERNAHEASVRWLTASLTRLFAHYWGLRSVSYEVFDDYDRRGPYEVLCAAVSYEPESDEDDREVEVQDAWDELCTDAGHVVAADVLEGDVDLRKGSLARPRLAAKSRAVAEGLHAGAHTRLVKLTEELGLSEEALDEAVHDAASRAASEANNAGVLAQVALLVERLGEAGAHDAIRAAAD